MVASLLVHWMAEISSGPRLVVVPVLTVLISGSSGGTKPLLSQHSATFSRFLVISVPHLSSLLTGESQQGVSAFQSTSERAVVTYSLQRSHDDTH